jgi:hypothetical protein
MITNSPSNPITLLWLPPQNPNQLILLSTPLSSTKTKCNFNISKEAGKQSTL